MGSCILRIPSVYGSKSLGRSQIVSRFISEAISSNEISVLKDPNSARAYLHIEDFLSAVSEIVNLVKEDQLHVIDLPGSEVKTATEVANLVSRKISEKLGVDVAITHKSRRYTHKRAVVSRAKNPLKSKARITLEGSLGQIIEDYRNEV